MTLSDEIRLWQEQMSELLQTGERLLSRVEELEQQNKLLREQVSKEGLRRRSMDELSAIYDDGYHVCHEEYSNPREGGDCLFCLSLLHSVGR